MWPASHPYIGYKRHDRCESDISYLIPVCIIHSPCSMLLHNAHPFNAQIPEVSYFCSKCLSHYSWWDDEQSDKKTCCRCCVDQKQGLFGASLRGFTGFYSQVWKGFQWHYARISLSHGMSLPSILYLYICNGLNWNILYHAWSHPTTLKNVSSPCRVVSSWCYTHMCVQTRVSWTKPELVDLYIQESPSPNQRR